MAEVWREVLSSLVGRLGAGPGRAFLVGGAVRDLLLGRAPRDVDLLIEIPENDQPLILSEVAALSGMEPVLFDRRPPFTHRVVVNGVIVDLSFCRPGGLDAALARRDFTINAMALPLAPLSAEPGGSAGVSPGMETQLMDPFGGAGDLRAQRIRTVDGHSLEDDPLRLLRAVRFAAALPGFAIEESTIDRIRSLRERIVEPAAERVQVEIELIFRTPRAGQAIRVADTLGLLTLLLPELEPLRGLEQPAHHHDHDAFDHSLRALAEADTLAGGLASIGVPALSIEETVILKWAALLHDVGKAATVTVDDDGSPHFYGHEMVSASLAEDALARLRVPSKIAEPVVKLIDLHLRPLALASAKAGERPVRRLVRAAGDLLPLLLLLALADRRASGGENTQEREAALVDLGKAAMRLRADVEAVAAAPPLLDGREIMAILGLAPGPRVGSISRWLERLRADGRITTRQEAEELLRSLPPSKTRD